MLSEPVGDNQSSHQNKPSCQKIRVGKQNYKKTYPNKNGKNTAIEAISEDSSFLILIMHVYPVFLTIIVF